MYNLLYPFVQSKKILRIIKISEKYNQRPSEILGIKNTHLAFCFDEAVEYILSYRYKKEVKKEGKVYLVDDWIEKPRWNDEEVEKPKNNADLIKEMQEELKKFK